MTVCGLLSLRVNGLSIKTSGNMAPSVLLVVFLPIDGSGCALWQCFKTHPIWREKCDFALCCFRETDSESPEGLVTGSCFFTIRSVRKAGYIFHYSPLWQLQSQPSKSWTHTKLKYKVNPKIQTNLKTFSCPSPFSSLWHTVKLARKIG